MSRKISFPQLFVLMSVKYFQLKALKAMGILSREQMRKMSERSEKNVKAKLKRALFCI